MNKRLKTLPLIFMLTAGAVNSIITYILHYEGKTALLILLAVLLLFYIMGSLFRKMILRFEDEIAKEEQEKLEEGKVLEKNAEAAEQNVETEAENGVKDSGEQ